MASRRGKGQPKAAPPPAHGRSAKAQPPASAQRATPLFCFEHADRTADPRWAFTPEPTHAQRLLAFVCEMGCLTWAEIEAQRASGHKRHHQQEAFSFCREAQRDFQRRELGEKFGETMFRFRLWGEARLWGFREGRVFHVVWWDPHHEIYPTEPA